MKGKSKSIVLIVFIFVQAATAQDLSLYQKRVFVSKQGDSLLYRMLLPENYDPSKEYPLVLFMHGAGERGNNNEKQLTHGGKMFLQENVRSKFPAIVIFPQCPADRYWVDISIRKKLHAKEEVDFKEVNNPPTRELALVRELLDSYLKTNTDRKRVYVIGLSMGGFGTFELIERWPKYFAAAVAICGGGNIDAAKRYVKKVPLWITHGAKDDIVPVRYSKRVYDKLVSLKANVKYTEFPEANHNAWDPTFAMPDLLPWMFSKTKK